MTIIPRRRRMLGWASAAAVLVVGGVAMHRFSAHATPMRALAAAHDPISGIVESVAFAQGRLIVSEVPVGQGGGFNGWYLTRTLWGWHVNGYGNVETHLGGAPIDWSAVAVQGKTLLWGVTERPMKSVILVQHGRSFSATVGKAALWHMTVPFGIGVIYDRQWSMQLPNGKTVPMYSST